jgi:hypothetical protein
MQLFLHRSSSILPRCHSKLRINRLDRAGLPHAVLLHDAWRYAQKKVMRETLSRDRILDIAKYLGFQSTQTLH